MAVSVDMYIPSVNGTNGTFLAVHVGPGGCAVSGYYGIYFTIFPTYSHFVVSSDISKSVVSQMLVRLSVWCSRVACNLDDLSVSV